MRGEWKAMPRKATKTSMKRAKSTSIVARKAGPTARTRKSNVMVAKRNGASMSKMPSSMPSIMVAKKNKMMKAGAPTKRTKSNGKRSIPATPSRTRKKTY